MTFWKQFRKVCVQVWHGDAGDNWKPVKGSGGRGEIPWNPSESGFPPGTFDLPSERPVPPQPIRPPAFSPRHSYGGQGTIHRTGTIDIQLHEETGEVMAVWFRCLNLPFTVSAVPGTDPVNTIGRVAIEEITYVDLPSEGNPQ